MEEDDGRKVCHWGVSICAHMSWLLCNRRCLTRITKTYSSGYYYCWYVKSQIYKIPPNRFCCLYFYWLLIAVAVMLDCNHRFPKLPKTYCAGIFSLEHQQGVIFAGTDSIKRVAGKIPWQRWNSHPPIKNTFLEYTWLNCFYSETDHRSLG